MDMVAWTTASFMAGALMLAAVMYALRLIHGRRDYVLMWGHYWMVLTVAYALLYIGVVTDRTWLVGLYMWGLVASGYVFYRATTSLLGVETNRKLEAVVMGIAVAALLGISIAIDEPIVLFMAFGLVPIAGFVLAGVLFIRRGERLDRVAGILALLLGVNFAFYVPLSTVESLLGALSMVTGMLGFLFAFAIILMYVHDVNEEQAAIRESLAYKSYHDGLTGLQNRAFFEEHIEHMDTPERWPISLMMVDMNRLKEVNDRFGHRIGDRMLIAVAKVLTRFKDPHGLLVRHGGDEFLMVLPRTEADEAMALKATIQEETAKTEFKGVPCTVAIGVACKRDASMSADALFDEAERAMYNDKVSN